MTPQRPLNQNSSGNQDLVSHHTWLIFDDLDLWEAGDQDHTSLIDRDEFCVDARFALWPQTKISHGLSRHVLSVPACEESVIHLCESSIKAFRLVSNCCNCPTTRRNHLTSSYEPRWEERELQLPARKLHDREILSSRAPVCCEAPLCASGVRPT